MSAEKKSDADQEFPRAKIKERWRVSPIWFVPILAAIVAGWLVFQDLRERGPLIHIVFSDATGVQANQTILKYRGVRIGNVQEVTLGLGGKQVEVAARLTRAAKNLASDGALFWIVRPEVGSTGLHGLETIVSGPYITLQPGNGQPETKFTGVEQPPTMKNSEGKLEIILTTPQINTLSAGSSVYYRGIQVGSVEYFVLNNEATGINIHILIETNFAPLIRAGTKFWNAGGINVHLKFFGVNISAENFKSLIIGGIAFATPEDAGPQAINQSVYELNDKVDDKWLKWSPSIRITNSQVKAADDVPSSILMNSVDAGDKNQN